MSCIEKAGLKPKNNLMLLMVAMVLSLNCFNQKCIKFVDNQSKTVNTKGITAVVMGKPIEIGNTSVGTLYREVSDKLQTLDLLQYNICEIKEQERQRQQLLEQQEREHQQKLADERNKEQERIKEQERVRQELLRQGIVEINGTKWATTNVGATRPEDYGNYYTIEEARNVCPSGWRLPTKSEFESLQSSESTWTGSGRNFGSGNNKIFLPAAGFYIGLEAYGTKQFYRDVGKYWSGTRDEKYYKTLYIDNRMVNVGIGGSGNGEKYTVRCVKY